MTKVKKLAMCIIALAVLVCSSLPLFGCESSAYSREKEAAIYGKDYDESQEETEEATDND